jgi:hypothetical protein
LAEWRNTAAPGNRLGAAFAPVVAISPHEEPVRRRLDPRGAGRRGGGVSGRNRCLLRIQAACPYLATVTRAGHSTFVTGGLPDTHGIVSNQWRDREAGRAVGCVTDPDQSLVSYAALVPKGGTSTKNLRVPAFPDELRLQFTPPPRIVTASLKEHTATTLAGRRADVRVPVRGTLTAPDGRVLNEALLLLSGQRPPVR